MGELQLAGTVGANVLRQELTEQVGKEQRS